MFMCKIFAIFVYQLLQLQGLQHLPKFPVNYLSILLLNCVMFLWNKTSVQESKWVPCAHGLFSTSGWAHGISLMKSSGLLQWRVRVWLPGPTVAEHEDHSLHSSHLPSKFKLTHLNLKITFFITNYYRPFCLKVLYTSKHSYILIFLIGCHS